MIITASNRLEEQKEYVNSLNVFPVPDGDTGTNMSMTFRAAVAEIETMNSDSIGDISKKLSKGALMGARGNSGVILSQIFRGIAKGFENKTEVNAHEFASSLIEGSKSAYKAVMRPTEGTILTIIRAAGESAVKSKQTDIAKLMKEVIEHSDAMLKKTPEMLPALKKANVVDSGGMGLLIILKGMYEALDKNIESATIQTVVSQKEAPSAAKSVNEEDIKFGYCTEFIIISEDVDVEELKNELILLGDSMVVVGLDDIVKVHIHTNDPGIVLSKALKCGELSRIKIDNMREEHRSLIVEEQAPSLEEAPSKEYAFIAVAMGDGIKSIFEDLGVDFVIEGGQTMNPSTQDILDCVNKLNANNIFVLPNNKNIIMAATQAAELSDKNVVVIPTKNIPQGITAVTMFNSDTNLTENISLMSDAISNVATGQITYAVRDTEFDGKAIQEGDILGLSEGKITEVGNDVYEICAKLISDMVTEDSELVSLFYGEDADKSKVDELVSRLEDTYPDMDIQCYDGKQPLYYFIISVE